MSDMRDMTDWTKLESIIRSHQPLDSKRTPIDEAVLLEKLMARVKGQDDVLRDVARLIRLSWMKDARSTPVCSLLFLGPTGTGKTELAKALAEALFGHEGQMIRIDCSELASPEMAKSRLTGSSQGFTGSDAGGHLTRPMFGNPKRVVLFDEIEKAHPLVFDLFLQMLGEGRLTEQGTGQVADFTQAVIVFTSNALSEQVVKSAEGLTDYRERLAAIKNFLAEAKVFRTEIIGRIDKIYLFKPLAGMVVAEISLLKIAKLGKEYGLEIRFVAPELVIQALEANHRISRFGIRELERILFDIFASALVEARAQGAKTVSFDVDEAGALVCRHEPEPLAP